MRLFHFTCTDHMPAIAKEGLRKGELAITPSYILRAVCLTTRPKAIGIGVYAGGPVSEEICKHFGLRSGMRWADKTRIRFEVEIEDDDIALEAWRTASLNYGADPKWMKQLEKAAGGPAWRLNGYTWYVYFGVIRPERLKAVDMRTGEEIPNWRTDVYA